MMSAMRELIIDSFAGGGGASTGIEMALGRSPDIAINHDAEALAMHAINHPQTLHLNNNVWRVDPGMATNGQPVGLAWFSPDCKHFSKAKGGRPVSRNVRDLAWVVVLWARRVRPRVILLENVEEFRDWGPITEDGQPCRERRGQTFEKWLGELRRLGYRVEHRELRACDYGAPTIRKRLFVIARRDGAPIVWPQPSHGDPTSADVLTGRLLPWRNAADIIDWSQPCHSIFLTPEEARAVGVKRPLADATMTRIARGVKRYVIDAARPYIVNLTHHGGDRCEDVAEPLRTVTGANRGEKALVVPVVSYAQQGGACRDVGDPLHTVCASTKDQNQIVAATLTKFSENSTGCQPDEPLHTVMPGAPRHGLVTAFLAQHNAGPRPGAPGRDMVEPVSTVTAAGSQQAVVSTFLSRQFGASVGSGSEAPVGTVTAGGGGKTAIVSAGLVSLKGSDRRDRPIDAPLTTVCAGGTHAAEVRAFLIKYYGNEETGHGLADPCGSVTTRDRFGLVMVEGEPYRIVDIGMRMLTPRELFFAQGFPASYVIDRGLMPDDTEIRLTKTAQVRMCGNSVCPPLAAALVRANYAPMEIAVLARDAGPLFGGVAA